ncbi:hypothetical protein Tco_0266045 [Tanacetum coccineum]
MTMSRRTIDQADGGKLCDHNAEESWALLEDLTLYDNESWNDPRDIAKPIKEIALPQYVSSTSDHRLIELKNQVQRLMEAHLAPTQPTQVNKITTSCVICSGPHDTQYCMEDPEQAFVEYASSRTDEAGVGALPSDTVKNPKLSTTPVLSARSYPIEDPQCLTHIHSSINTITIHPTQPEESQVRKVNSMLESLELVPRFSNAKFVCSKRDDGEVMFIEIIRDDDEPQKEGPNEGEGATTEELAVEYFNTFPTRDELTYHRSSKEILRRYRVCRTALAVLVTGASQSRQHGWSGLQLFQYLRSRNEKAIECVVLRENKKESLRGFEWLRRVVHCISGP